MFPFAAAHANHNLQTERFSEGEAMPGASSFVPVANHIREHHNSSEPYTFADKLLHPVHEERSLYELKRCSAVSESRGVEKDVGDQGSTCRASKVNTVLWRLTEMLCWLL